MASRMTTPKPVDLFFFFFYVYLNLVEKIKLVTPFCDKFFFKERF
jgi:hypothetical protein